MKADNTQLPSVPPDEIQLLKDFMEKYGKQLSIALTVILVTVLAAQLIRANHRKNLRTASVRLGTANALPELEAVVTDFGSTPAAPLALLRVARGYYDEGNYDLALTKYDEFSTQYAKHDFAVGAKLGRIQCVEAKGQIAEALTAYVDFIGQHPRHYLLSEAFFGRGRCLELMGRYKEARTVYEDFMAANPGTPWLARIEERLEEIARRTGEQPEETRSAMTDLAPAATE